MSRAIFWAWMSGLIVGELHWLFLPANGEVLGKTAYVLGIWVGSTGTAMTTAILKDLFCEMAVVERKIDDTLGGK